jgi:integrase
MQKNRPYVHRGRQVPGVHQRCISKCPAEACRSNHKWEYVVELPDLGGGRRRISDGGFATGAEAAEARDEVVAKERAGTQPRDHKLTVAEWLQEWLTLQQDVRGIGEGTYELYRQHVQNYWIPGIGNLRLADLKPHHVTNTIAKIRKGRDDRIAKAEAHNLKARAEALELDKARIAKRLKRPVKPKLVKVPRPVGPSTANRILGTLRSALSAAARTDLVTRNVASQAEKPRVRHRKVRPWSPDALGAWLDSIAEHRLYPLFHLGVFAGMRRGELAGLRWQDVDLDACVVVVRWQITDKSYRKARAAIKRDEQPKYLRKPKTRDGEERVIDLDPETVDVLRIWQKVQAEEEEALGRNYANADGLVFTRENGTPLDPHQIYLAFVKSVVAIGYEPVPVHLLRHTSASIHIAGGVDIAIISKRLGHSRISLTADTYGHLIGKAGREAAIKGASVVPRGSRVLADIDVERSSADAPAVADARS